MSHRVNLVCHQIQMCDETVFCVMGCLKKSPPLFQIKYFVKIVTNTPESIDFNTVASRSII